MQQPKSRAGFRLGGESGRRRGASRIFAGVLVLAAWLLGAVGASAAPSFETTLDRDHISLGETVTLSLVFHECNPSGQPQLPAINGLEQTGNNASSESMEVVNGHMSQTMTYTIELRPTHVGSFTIPGLQLALNGARLSSKPLTLVVAKGTGAPQPGANKGAFVKLVVPEKPVYAGEAVPVEIQCYCKAAQQVQLPQLSGDGFNIGSVPNFTQQPPPQVVINNEQYNFLNFRVAVTPIKTGALTLGPASWSLALLDRRAPNFPFGFGFAEPHQVTVSSESAAVRVLPIPTNAPPGFTGAIGTFTLAQYEAGPTNVAVGDPITLKIRLTGRGAFDGVSLPTDPVGWREFKTYPATSKFDSTDPMQIEGSKYFEQVITPLNAEIKEIPAFHFVYFDPDTGRFATLSHPPLALSVHPASGVAQPTVVSLAPSTAETPPPAQEIVHIKEHLGRLQTVAPPLIERPWFLFLNCLPPLAWLSALIWRRQKEKMENNPRLRRQRETDRRIEEGLQELSGYAASNQTPEFYATVFRLLQERLGERLDLPASAITEAAVQDARNNGLNAETEKQVRELFHACDQYRYAPERSSQEMASIIPKLQSVLRELRKLAPSRSAPAAALQGLGCLLLLLAAGSLRAQSSTPEAAFDAANKLYEEGKYTHAAAAYQRMIDSGRVSAPVYFNLGNAWFKAGQPGRAIFAYRRAEALAPRDPDVRANLQFTRNQVAGGSGIALHPWMSWCDRLTLNEWAAAAAATLAIFFLVLTARQIWPRTRSGIGLPVALAAISALLLGCLTIAAQDRLGEQTAVVIAPEAVARLGPLEESQSAFTVRDGTELSVLDQKGEWLEVADGGKRTGWVMAKDVMR